MRSGTVIVAGVETRSGRHRPMPRITKVYTKTGDDGTTALGGGQRVGKDSIRIDAYGTVDELNSVLGVARAAGLDHDTQEVLARVQNDLFHLGSDLCFLEEDKAAQAVPRIEARHIEALEAAIDRASAELEPLANFILPGGCQAAAQLHVGRTVCRRAERLLVALSREQKIGEHGVRYLNRLSDLLFVLARLENRRSGSPDVLWDSGA